MEFSKSGKKLEKAFGILCFSGNKLRRPSWKSLFLGHGNRTTIELISVSVFLKNPTSPHHWTDERTSEQTNLCIELRYVQLIN